MDKINFKTAAFANICVVNVEKSVPDKRIGILKHAIRNIYILLEVYTNNYKFAHHLLENGQAFGKIDEIMEIKHFARKAAHMDSTERFFYI
jgi:hypothetical protein